MVPVGIQTIRKHDSNQRGKIMTILDFGIIAAALDCLMILGVGVYLVTMN